MTVFQQNLVVHRRRLREEIRVLRTMEQTFEIESEIKARQLEIRKLNRKIRRNT